MKYSTSTPSPDMLRKIQKVQSSGEAPRKKLIVSCLYRIFKLFNGKECATPHLLGGANLDKTEYEYDKARLYWDEIRDYFSIEEMAGKDILDVGCGWGGDMVYNAEHTALKTISGFEVPLGYDPQASFNFAEKKNIKNCYFKTGYAEDMPYEDEKFDIVYMKDVMEHVSDPKKVIKECYRVLRKGGRLVIRFPSIRMMHAHHLDRVITIPALHYILPLKTWAAGLNYILLHDDDCRWTPFDKVVSTKYSKAIVKNLNGLDFKSFTDIVRRSDFETICNKLAPFTLKHFKNNEVMKFFIMPVYNAFFHIPPLKEFLAHFVIYIGEKRS